MTKIALIEYANIYKFGMPLTMFTSAFCGILELPDSDSEMSHFGPKSKCVTKMAPAFTNTLKRYQTASGKSTRVLESSPFQNSQSPMFPECPVVQPDVFNTSEH